MTALAGLGYQTLWKPAPAAWPSENTGSTILSLQVKRLGSDLLVNWNRNTPVILNAKAGTLRIRDGNSAQQELRLDADQLLNSSVRYTPVTNNVQFRIQVLSAGGQTVNEWVLTLAAPRVTALAGQQHPLSVKYPLSHNLVSYAVQVGTFRNRANAEHLRNAMEARHGPTRLVSQASNPSLWRVVVGRETTLEDASRLAERIRTDRRAKTNQVLVIRDEVSGPPI